MQVGQERFSQVPKNILTKIFSGDILPDTLCVQTGMLPRQYAKKVIGSMNSGSTDVDLLLAIQLQEQFEEELRHQGIPAQNSYVESIPKLLSSPTNQPKGSPQKHHGASTEPLSVSLVDPVWELIDPVPDVHSLFCTYNDQFFWGKLHTVAVSWSPRMTVCAGVCSYERRGGLCSIRLSVPLLKLRPRSDLVETLLHEMIHAYLFVTANNRDRDGHGPEFHKHMHRINQRAMTKISVYHSFHSEVAVYKQHVWQCSGPCRRQRPYYGLVKRSMNRAPGPNDRWWAQHQASCGGSYSKIREPEGFGVKGAKAKGVAGSSGVSSKRKDANNSSSVQSRDIRDFFTGAGKSLGKNSSSQSSGSSSSSVNPSIKKPTPASRNAATEGKTSTGAGNSWKTSGTPSDNGTDTRSNIRGFGSNSNASVTQVGVSNAPRSNIVGFNKGLNKISANKNSNSSSTNAKGAISTSGSLGGKASGSGTSGVSNKSDSHSTSNPKSSGTGMRGGGLAGFGGSGTVLVKPRPTKTTLETKTKEVDGKYSNAENVEAGSSDVTSVRPAFSGGTGFVLGGGRNLSSDSNSNGQTQGISNRAPRSNPGRPMSRLLAEYDAAVKSQTQPTAFKRPLTLSGNIQGSSSNTTMQGSRPSLHSNNDNCFRNKRGNHSMNDNDSDSGDDVPLDSTYRNNSASCKKNKTTSSNNNKTRDEDRTVNDSGEGSRSSELPSSADRTVLLDSDSEEENPDDTHRECPLCCHPVPRTDFCDHIAECVGDWDLITFDDFQMDLKKEKSRFSENDRGKRRNADDDNEDKSSSDDEKDRIDRPRLNGIKTSHTKRRKKDFGEKQPRKEVGENGTNRKGNCDPVKEEPCGTGHDYGDCSADFFDDLEEDVSESLEERALGASSGSSVIIDPKTKDENSLPKTVDNIKSKTPASSLTTSKLKKRKESASKSSSSSTVPSKTNKRGKKDNHLLSGEDKYIYVSDTDDEFDERYWHTPVSSIVQRSHGESGGVCGGGSTLTTATASVRIPPPPTQARTSRVALPAAAQPQPASSAAQAKEASKYPCPVCQELFTEEYITAVHLNTHFS